MFQSFFRFLGRLRRQRRVPPPTRRPARFLPRVEALEDRWVPSTIGGNVYNDANLNGLLDPGEPGIGSNTVQLYNSAGTLIGTTQTDANGHYLFTTDQTVNTTPLTQEVDANFPTTPTDSSLTQAVAQFNPALGTLTGVEIDYQGTLTSAIQIDSLDSSPSNVTGTVSGTLNLQGPGLSSLTLNPTTTEQAAVGSWNGKMDFSGPSAFNFGPKTAQDSKSITLDASQTDLSAWEGNGTVSLTETAQATSSASGPGNLLSLINSTSAGEVKVVYHYTPSNALTPGSYTVVQPQDPPGYTHGQNTGDNQHPLPPGPTNSIPVTLTNGDSPNNNFGEVKPAGLSGFVYSDPDNDGVMQPGEQGLGGVTVQLTGTDYRGNPVSQTQQTAADGSYGFVNLLPGTYSLTKTTTPAGYLDGKDTVGSQGGQAGPGGFTQINLTQGVSGTNNNFAEIQTGSLSGHVYLDANQDGVMDPGDQPLAGVTVSLSGTTSGGLAVNATTQTAADGSYTFGNLLAGSYTITKTPPAGYLDGSENVGSLGGTAANDQFFLALSQGATGLNYNFGELLPPSVQPPAPPPPDTAPPPQAPPPPPAPVANPFGPLSKRDFIGNTWLLLGW